MPPHNPNTPHAAPPVGSPQDAPLETALDDFARLAALTCDAPIALVCLSDGTHRWFKTGADLETGGTPHGAVVCAATPLTTSTGDPLGTLRVMDLTPRALTEVQQEALQVLARCIGTQIELSRRLAESAPAAEDLRESEARFQSIVANTPGMVYRFVLRPDGSMAFPFVSQGCREIYGVEPESAQRDPMLILNTLPPEDHADFATSVAESARTLDPWSWQRRIVLADGSERWIQAASRPRRQVNGDVLWDGVLVDVTDRVCAEKALGERAAHLRRSNSLLQAQQEAAIDGILIVDENKRIVSYNRRLCELWHTPEEVIQSGDDQRHLAYALSLMAQPEEFLAKVLYLYDHPKESSRDELRLKDGRVLDRYSSPVVGEDGQDYGRVWYFRDITERKSAEEALRASEERLRTVVGGLPLILFALDTNAVITFSDGRGLNALGLRAGEDVGKSMLELYEGYPEVQDTIRRALAGETVSIIQEFVGSVFETQFIPRHDSEDVLLGVIGVAVDVTERRWAEQQILGLNAELEQRLDRIGSLNHELAQAYEATIEGWSRVLDMRDHETEGHSLRVTEMTMRLAQAFGLPDEEQVQIRRGALLHDIGKMGVPDAILRKPGALTDEEWVVMRRHPEYAREMLMPVEFLRPALVIPSCHHEKWDGTGYPRGLRGEEIPLAARIFAVVDVWDALRSDRPYRRAWSVEKTRDHIASLSGSHFDPRVTELFLREIAPLSCRNHESFSPSLQAA